MQKRFCLIIILPLLALYSCSNDPLCCVLPEPPVKITAVKNGADWAPLFAKATLSNIDSLSISATSTTYQSNVYNKIDTLNIKIAYTSPGTYALSGNMAYYGVFKNAGVTGYKLDYTYHNVIVITGYQRFTNPNTTVADQARITGTFSMMFVDPGNPSGINFQSGSFTAMVPYQ